MRPLIVGLAIGLLVAAAFVRRWHRRPPARPAKPPPVGVLTAAVPARPLAEIARARGLATDPIRDARLEVDKSEYELRFLAGDVLLKRYPVALGPRQGDKQRRDDGCTPEGEFRIVERVVQSEPRRWRDVWMRLNYPLPEDAERGLAAGLIDREQRDAIVAAGERREIPPRNTRLGSGIGIHIGGITPRDWTEGCIALQTADGVEVAGQVRAGTRVVVRP